MSKRVGILFLGKVCTLKLLLPIRKHSNCENGRFLARIVVNSHSFALRIYPSFCQMRWEFASIRTTKIDRISVKSSPFRIHSNCKNARFLARIIVNSHSFALRIYPFFFRQMRWQFASIRTEEIDRISVKSSSFRIHSNWEKERFLARIIVNSHSLALRIYPFFFAKCVDNSYQFALRKWTASRKNHYQFAFIRTTNTTLFSRK